jgi:hypothetical protein
MSIITIISMSVFATIVLGALNFIFSFTTFLRVANLTAIETRLGAMEQYLRDIAMTPDSPSDMFQGAIYGGGKILPIEEFLSQLRMGESSNITDEQKQQLQDFLNNLDRQSNASFEDDDDDDEFPPGDTFRG